MIDIVPSYWRVIEFINNLNKTENHTMSPTYVSFTYGEMNLTHITPQAQISNIYSNSW